mmetsp:Transcript_38932/g.105434  ORF Transcript_38932/g.105434 Transcript_38932/m.105434 type:complete len:282 (+) Transcript_38932:607-1452(+)
MGRVGRDDYALALGGRGRQPLVELLREVRQQRVHEPHRPIEADVQHLSRHLAVGLGLLVLAFAVEAGLQQLEIDVAEFVEEEAVGCRGGVGKLVLLKRLVGLLGAEAEPRQDPPVLPGQGRHRREGAGEAEVVAEVAEAEARGVPDLVAEVAVPDHSVDVEVYVPSLQRVGQQAEAQGVRTALRDAVGEVLLLALLGLLDLLVGEVPLMEFVLQGIKGDALNHLDGVDHIAQALGHLAPMGVTHHGMQVDRGEGQLPRQADRHHDHSRYPEEQDVVTSLQQ